MCKPRKILETSRNMQRYITIIALLLMPCVELPAQTDWLSKGRELFESADHGGSVQSQLSAMEIESGLKEALQIGTERVVAQLGRPGGFNADPAIRIPLPDTLKTVKSTLDMVGMGESLNELEIRLNRAAETATPKAKQLFWDAITRMTLEDVKSIYRGPDDAATQYFKKQMAPELRQEMAPVVARSLSEVGAIQYYDTAIAQYKSTPFVPDVKADLNGYVVDKGIDGIFHYLAIQEAEIRKNPAKQTTDLLKRVFGGQY